MARAIKWRLQFKSLSGVGCLVNIYQTNHTSSADTTKTGADVPFTVESGVKSLTGAAVPFEYQEEDGENLLDLIRYRTGYIRVIEETFDELADLIPTTLTGHYVEAFYGSELVFTGYMQMQSFQQPWTAVPRELEFPIISPLGLLSSFEFAKQEPTVNIIGYLLKAVADGLDAGYTHVAWPYDSNNQIYPWGEAISGTVASPLNEDFKPYDTSDNLYKPNTYEYFLHGLCATMGWMLHDWPGRLFFSSPGCNGCSLLPLASAAAGMTTGMSTVPGNDGILTYFKEADNDATISTNTPLKSLELKADGEGKVTHALPTQYGYRLFSELLTYFKTGGKWGFGGSLHSPGSVVQSGFTIGTVIWSGGTIANSPIAALVIYAVNDEDNLTLSPSTFWVVYPGTLSSSNTMLLGFRTYGIYESGKYIFKLTLEKGTDMKDMQSSGWDNDLTLQLVIKNLTNGKTLDISSGQWSSGMNYNSITIDKGTGKVESNAASGDWTSYSDIDGILFDMPGGIKDIEVSIYASSSSGIDNDEIIKFTDMSFCRVSSWGDNVLDWSEEFDEKKSTIQGSDKGVDDGSLTLEINNLLYFDGSHSFLGSGSADIADKYAHVFTPYSFLREVFRLANNGSTFAWYAKGFSYWRQGWGWHLLAHSFNMRDDEVGLVMMTPNVSSDFVQTYSVGKNLMGVSVTTPARVNAHSSVEWTLIAQEGLSIDYVQVKMGGVDITSTAYNSATKKITIADVTGDIIITATASAVTYQVTTNLTNVTFDGASTATGGEEYQAMLTPAAHAAITSVTIEMGGEDVSQFYNDGLIDIPYVTGDIEITAEAESAEYSITANFTHVHAQMYYPEVEELPEYVDIGSRLTFKLIEDEGYPLAYVQVLMGGVDITNQVRYSDAISIEHVTGNVVITAIAGVAQTVTCNLDGVTSDAPASVTTGRPLTVVLTTPSGSQVNPLTVHVSMGGVDITATAYDHSTQTIYIAVVDGEVEIDAESIAVPTTYKPVEYISIDSASAGSVLTLGYKPNSNTKIELDVKLKDVAGVIYGTLASSSASASKPNFFAFIKITSSNGRMGFGSTESGSNNSLRVRVGARFTFICDQGNFSFVNRSGVASTYTLTQGTWTMNTNVCIFGRYNSSDYCGAGTIYRVTISENGAVLHDYVPVKRVSDGQPGLYDIVSGVSTPYISAASYSLPEDTE